MWHRMSHELDSVMLLIHPPLAIAGYVFIFLFTIFIFTSNDRERRITTLSGFASWLLIGLGLLTGMIWAQFAWGSYWSWDPKETLTLLLFVTCSTCFIVYREKKHAMTKILAATTFVLTIITAASSLLVMGLHSFV